MYSILISNKENIDKSVKAHSTYNNYHITNKDDEQIWSNENYADNAVIDTAQDNMYGDAQKLYNQQNVQIIVL